jgi:hypothetical protein
MAYDHQPPPSANLLIFGGQKIRSTKKIPTIPVAGKKVPDKPLQTHNVNLSSIISTSSIAMMGIFPSCKKSWMLCKPKSLRAS